MTSPWNEQNRNISRQTGSSMFDVGKVEDVTDNEGKPNLVPHLAKVNVRGQDSSTWMPVIIPVHGDVNIPLTDTRVLVGYMKGNKPFAIPVYAGDDDVREYDVGERILGHKPTDAFYKITPNGELKLVDEFDNRLVTNENGSTILEDNTSSILELNNFGETRLEDKYGSKYQSRYDGSITITSNSGVTLELQPDGEFVLTDNHGNSYQSRDNGSITIKSSSGVTLELQRDGEFVLTDNHGNSYQSRDSGSIKIDSNSGASMELKSTGGFKLTDINNSYVETNNNGDAEFNHQSGSTITFKDNGDVIIDSDRKTILGGDDSISPVARKGDSVEVNGNTGTITEGSNITESK